MTHQQHGDDFWVQTVQHRTINTISTHKRPGNIAGSAHCKAMILVHDASCWLVQYLQTFLTSHTNIIQIEDLLVGMMVHWTHLHILYCLQHLMHGDSAHSVGTDGCVALTQKNVPLGAALTGAMSTYGLPSLFTIAATAYAISHANTICSAAR